MTAHKPRRLALTEMIPMRWGDMDALGHINNTVYFRYMEQARMRFLEVAGLYGDPAQTTVVVNAHCNFRRALVYPGTVEVKLYLGEPGRSSIESYYDINLDGELYADGSAKIVWIDIATGRSAPLPERFRAHAA